MHGMRRVSVVMMMAVVVAIVIVVVVVVLVTAVVMDRVGVVVVSALRGGGDLRAADLESPDCEFRMKPMALSFGSSEARSRSSSAPGRMFQHENPASSASRLGAALLSAAAPVWMRTWW
jgi:hypothetical protein